MLICREICFVAIYAVLAQNLFCRDLRTFVWRKIYSEIVLVEKKGQISGMIQDEFDIYIHNDEMHGRQKMVFVIQGGFFLLVPPQKVLSVRLHSKSHQSVRIYLPADT